MKQTETSIAKISRPRLPDVLRRPRLFRLLDQGRRSPVTWVSGPAGSGKTTLVASWLDARKLQCLWYHLDEGDGDLATFFYYLSLAAKRAAPRHRKPLPLLTTEYLRGIPTFTRRYFENLCSRLKPPFVIVLDNYHHVATESPFHNMIREALSVVPDGITVMTISRGAPPPSLALLGTYNKMQTIGWDDLKFDRSEIESLLRSERKKKPNGQLLAQIESMTTGWAAGLVLLLERLRSRGLEPHDLDQVKSHEFFDYFASELFEKTDQETRSFLLTTAFLPHITAKAANALTGNRNAGTLLASLSRNHFFTEQRSRTDPVYQYHPLFREFLQARVRDTFSAGDALEIQRRAAQVLEESGQFEDAAALYRTSGSWEGLARIILMNARSMMSQGRYRPLEEWLKSLPGDVLEGDPWLLYWMGVCRMPLHLPEGHGYFERALSLFRKRNDAAGVFRAWSGAIEALVQEMRDIKRLDAWVSLVFELMKKYDFPSPEIEDEVTARIFTAMPWDPADPNFITWRKQAMELINRNADPTLRLMTAFYLLAHHIWIGEYSTGRIALGVIRRLAKTYENISPLAYCMGRMCEGWFVWLSGDHHLCYSIMQDALTKAEESGVHIWDKNIMELGVAASMCKGALPEAGRQLEQMAVGLESSRLFDRFYYHLASAWRFMVMGDMPQAVTHQKLALDLAAKTGFPINASEGHFGMAIILNARGDRIKAKEHAAALHTIGSRMGSALVEYKALLIDAVLAFDAGDGQAGLKRLRDALELGKEKGFVYFKWWLPSMMTRLCMKALEAGIETDHTKYLIRTCKLVPVEPPLHIEQWPWPVKLVTLGDFRILLDDKPVVFSGKVQKKPLEMLKALIALGGSGIREDQLTDALWPDAEGDAAGTAFRTTLHRLRQLIGNEKAIVVQEGRVSLDPRYCWADVWAFERILENAECGVRSAELQEENKENQNREVHIDHLEKGLALYRGHFLEADEDKPWTASTRERLRSKFLRAVKAQGDHWLQEAESLKRGDGRKAALKRAIECYERGLEVDHVAEEFYQNLMLCHQQTGSRAEALKVYKRCKAALSNAFGIEPSEETEEIYKKIVGDR